MLQARAHLESLEGRSEHLKLSELVVPLLARALGDEKETSGKVVEPKKKGMSTSAQFTMNMVIPLYIVNCAPRRRNREKSCSGGNRTRHFSTAAFADKARYH